MHPTCRITVDGKLVSGVFMSRLISAEVTDREGIASDSVRVDLNDDPPAAIPRTGAIMRIWMGYGVSGMAYMGAYEVEEVEVQFIPYKMTLTGKAAGFKGKTKENKEKSWSDKKLETVITDVAKSMGFEAVIDPEIGSIKLPWIGQLNESGISFLQRLAERNNALVSVKDGKLVVAKRGTGKSASGKDLTPVIVTPKTLQQGSGRVTFSDRYQYKSVKASHQDRDKAKRTDHEEKSDGEGKAVYRIGERFQDADEAKRAAKAKANELARNKARFGCSIIGEPSARAGAPLKFLQCRPGIDGTEFIIETATHSYTKSSYVTRLDGKLKV